MADPCCCCQGEGVVPVFRGRMMVVGKKVACPLCHGIPEDAEKNYNQMVMGCFEDLEHEDRREFLEQKSAVERKARQAF